MAIKLKSRKLKGKENIAKFKKQAFRAAFLTFKVKVLMLQSIFEANFFNYINVLNNNFNKTQDKIYA